MNAIQSSTNTAAQTAPEIIGLDNIHFGYSRASVLNGLSMSVRERDFVGVIGPNGSGKTTVLKLIVGLLQPQKGQIRLFGEPAEQFRQRNRIGYVPQKTSLNPLFPATVREVVMSGLIHRKRLFRPYTARDIAKCDDALQALDIAQLANRKIGQLSGGQQQRTFLARALINNPDLLILDEPTVGIDSETQEAFFRMVKHMHQHHRIAFLMVSHDVEMMRSYLGYEPTDRHNQIGFYVRSADWQAKCDESDLTHSLRGLKAT